MTKESVGIHDKGMRLGFLPFFISPFYLNTQSVGMEHSSPVNKSLICEPKEMKFPPYANQVCEIEGLPSNSSYFPNKFEKSTGGV